MAKVTQLAHWSDGSWTWHLDGDERHCYYTNRMGEGIFTQDLETGNTRQLTGTCQFSAPETVSGMRRKLNRWFNGD